MITNLNKIEVYTEVDHNTVIVTDHAIEQASKRFQLKNNTKTKVSEWIRNKYKNSHFKTTIQSERYGIARLFVNNDIGMVIDIHKDVILTIYPLEIRKEVKSEIQKFLEQKCKQLTKQCDAKIKSHQRKIAKYEKEKYKLKYDILNVRTQSSYNSIQARINSLDIEIATLMKELFDLQVKRDDYELSLTAVNSPKFMKNSD